MCGCGHSGTTLLARILGAHPQIYVPPNETNAFLDEKKMGDRLDRLRQNTLASRKPYLVEKTPRHLRRMNAIRAGVPGAKFVIIVRDGRDVAASIGKREDGDYAGGLARWVKDNARVLKERRSKDVHVLRYEDIVTDAEGTIRKVCRFLGVAYDDQMLRYHERPANWFGRKEVREVGRPGKEHGDLRNWQVNQPIYDGRGQVEKGSARRVRGTIPRGRTARNHECFRLRPAMGDWPQTLAWPDQAAVAQAGGLGGSCWPGVETEILVSSSVISAGTSAKSGVER